MSAPVRQELVVAVKRDGITEFNVLVHQYGPLGVYNMLL